MAYFKWIIVFIFFGVIAPLFAFLFHDMYQPKHDWMTWDGSPYENGYFSYAKGFVTAIILVAIIGMIYFITKG